MALRVAMGCLSFYIIASYIIALHLSLHPHNYTLLSHFQYLIAKISYLISPESPCIQVYNPTVYKYAFGYKMSTIVSCLIPSLDYPDFYSYLCRAD